jgi:hypothetical protein
MKLSNQYFMMESLLAFRDTFQYVLDLKTRVVENRTEVDFVISDDPAILMNRYATRKIETHQLWYCFIWPDNDNANCSQICDHLL